MLEKKTGLYHLLASFKYAFDGLSVLIKEVAFKHEVMFLLANYCIFILVSAKFSDYIIALILWLILIAFEAVNTVIEMIIDKLSPEICDFAKKTKDIASFSVFCLVVANLLFTVLVIAF